MHIISSENAFKTLQKDMQEKSIHRQPAIPLQNDGVGVDSQSCQWKD